MIKERIYAVVDLETTGPKQDGSDKIIQIGRASCRERV